MSFHAAALRQRCKIRAGQIGGYRPAIVLVVLKTTHISVGVIVENDDYQWDIVVHGGCELSDGEHCPTIAHDRNHRNIPAGMGCTEPGSQAPAKRALIARA